MMMTTNSKSPTMIVKTPDALNAAPRPGASGRLRGAVWVAALALLACDPEPDADAEERGAAVENEAGAGVQGASHENGTRSVGPSQGKQDRQGGKQDKHRQKGRKHGHGVMPDAERVFGQALEIIDERYVDPADRDRIFTNALDGVMAGLIQIDGHPINALLSPDELGELMSGTRGTIVGVGVMIEMVADVLVVRDVVPGGAAEAAGLQRGDRILGIDGQRIAGQELAEIVGRIRGPAGTEVELFVQRDTEEWEQKLRRDIVELQNVDSRSFADGIGYVRLRGFAETTADELDAALTKLEAEGMKRLIIDVRHCPGGLLDAGVTITSRFLSAGDEVVSIADRKKGEKKIVATEDGRWRELPLAVLIGPKTASSAEIMADALATHAGATLVGAPSMGKGSVESIHELDNGWALKLSSGRFVGASGELRLGHGVEPQLPAPEAEGHGKSKPRPVDELDDGTDVALGLARSWLAGGK